jgi:hypothetical protein
MKEKIISTNKFRTTKGKIILSSHLMEHSYDWLLSSWGTKGRNLWPSPPLCFEDAARREDARIQGNTIDLHPKKLNIYHLYLYTHLWFAHKTKHIQHCRIHAWTRNYIDNISMYTEYKTLGTAALSMTKTDQVNPGESYDPLLMSLIKSTSISVGDGETS